MTQRTNQPVQLTFDKAVAALHKVGGGVQCSDGVTPTRWLAAKAGISVPALTMALRKHDRDERLITRVTKGKRTFSIRVTTGFRYWTSVYPDDLIDEQPTGVLVEPEVRPYVHTEPVELPSSNGYDYDALADTLLRKIITRAAVADDISDLRAELDAAQEQIDKRSKVIAGLQAEVERLVAELDKVTGRSIRSRITQEERDALDRLMREAPRS